MNKGDKRGDMLKINIRIVVRVVCFKYLYTNKINLKNANDMRTGYTQIDEWPVRPYSKRELAMAYAPRDQPRLGPEPAGGMDAV